jgi:RNA polymerase sigma factor (sigma-70 family)
MPPTDETGTQRYFEAVLTMLQKVARGTRRQRPPAMRTSDVVQEVFVRLETKVGRGESVESLVPFAATVARHLLIDWHRKHRAELVPADVLEGAVRTLRDTGIEPLDLEAMLTGLEPNAAAVVELRIFAGLVVREIVTVTGETEHFVRQTLKAANQSLARLAKQS